MVVISQGQLEELILAGKPIENADLSQIDWTDLAPGRIVARKCVFRESSMVEAELVGALFENCTFENVRFAGANLTDARFVRCALFNAVTRQGCDFSRADLENASFENCNLSTARFHLARLFDATFDKCKASGCDFEDAIFSRKGGGRIAIARVRFAMTLLDMANFRQGSLEECIFTDCGLRQTDFRQATLAGADLSGSDLSEAVLDGAMLDNADLRGATLYGINITQLAGFENVKVSSDQLSDIVRALGIKVFPSRR